jgi:hypothetical protein
VYKKETPASVVVLDDTDDDNSDNEDNHVILVQPSNPLNDDPCIEELGPINDSIQSEMFPEGIPDYYDTSLPFHPSHQYVNRSQCTNEGLQQVTTDIQATLI